MQFDDPILRVESESVSLLEDALGPATLHMALWPFSRGNREFGRLRRSYGNRVILEFKTLTWNLAPYPFDRGHTRIRYKGRARLLDLENSRIMWKAGCEVVEKDPWKERLSMEELRRRRGRMLRLRLLRAADECSEELLAKLQAELQ
jgi:hypothetical protein